MEYVCDKDVQGNIVAIVDGTGCVMVEYNYDAWGRNTCIDDSTMISGMLGAAFGALSGGGAQHGKNLTLKSKLKLRNQRKVQGKSIRAVEQQIRDERALLSKVGLRELRPNEMLLYDFVLEYAAYGTLGMFFD